MKFCIRCKRRKNESEFYKRADGSCNSPCKTCKSIYDKERHKQLSQSLEWRVYRSEINKQYYYKKKNESLS